MEIKELEKKIDDNYEKVNISIDKRIKHLKPTKETLEMINNVKGALDIHIKSQDIYEKKTSKLLEEIIGTLDEMKPSYRMIKRVETTGEVLTKVSRVILYIVFFLTTMIGAVYGVKEWIKR